MLSLVLRIPLVPKHQDGDPYNAKLEASKWHKPMGDVTVGSHLNVTLIWVFKVSGGNVLLCLIATAANDSNPVLSFVFCPRKKTTEWVHFLLQKGHLLIWILEYYLNKHSKCSSILRLFSVTPSLPYLEPSRVSSEEALASAAANVSNLFHAQPNPPHSSNKIPSLRWGLEGLAFKFQLPNSRTLARGHLLVLYQSSRKISLNREKGQRREFGEK